MRSPATPMDEPDATPLAYSVPTCRPTVNNNARTSNLANHQNTGGDYEPVPNRTVPHHFHRTIAEILFVLFGIMKFLLRPRMAEHEPRRLCSTFCTAGIHCLCSKADLPPS